MIYNVTTDPRGGNDDGKYENISVGGRGDADRNAPLRLKPQLLYSPQPKQQQQQTTLSDTDTQQLTG